MKKALVTLDDYAKQWKLNYKFIGNIHDEVQSEVVAEQAEKFGWLAVECLKAAGHHFHSAVLSTESNKVENVVGDALMMNNNRKGDFAEFYAVTWLWDSGYEVFLNAGATGPMDMVAIKDGDVTLIDVKTLTA